MAVTAFKDWTIRTGCRSLKVRSREEILTIMLPTPKARPWLHLAHVAMMRATSFQPPNQPQKSKLKSGRILLGV